MNKTYKTEFSYVYITWIRLCLDSFPEVSFINVPTRLEFPSVRRRVWTACHRTDTPLLAPALRRAWTFGLSLVWDWDCQKTGCEQTSVRVRRDVTEHVTSTMVPNRTLADLQSGRTHSHMGRWPFRSPRPGPATTSIWTTELRLFTFCQPASCVVGSHSAFNSHFFDYEKCERIFMYLLTIWNYSFVKYLFKSFSIFLNCSFFFKNVFYGLFIVLLLAIAIANNFPILRIIFSLCSIFW